jgi:putative endonuclease
MLKEYHVYILLCSDGTYYTGMTSNLEKRMLQHDNSEFPRAYTARRRPLKLEFTATFSQVYDAIEFEKRIKKWSGQKKKALIEGDFDRLKDLAQCRNLTNYKIFIAE